MWKRHAKVALYVPILMVACALAQEGMGARIGSQAVPPFTLTIGEITGRHIEHTSGDIPFKLTANVPPPGVATPKKLMVCPYDLRNCVPFSNLVPPQEKTGTVSAWYPLAGNPIQLVACEILGEGINIHCGQTLAIDQKVIPLSANFTVYITDITVFHTRALSKDTTWITLLANPDFSTIKKEDCNTKIPHQPHQSCQTFEVGDIQDGSHDLRKLNARSGEFTFPVNSEASFKFAFAVWNYGFEMMRDWGNLSDALFDAAKDTFSTISPGEQLDLTPALNDHSWHGCDGPTAGTAFRMTGTNLDQLTRETGSFSQTIRYVVKSQIGCGASSQYAVTFKIVRIYWHDPAVY